MKVVWSPLALEKLEAAAKSIAIDKASAADKWVNDVFAPIRPLTALIKAIGALKFNSKFQTLIGSSLATAMCLVITGRA